MAYETQSWTYTPSQTVYRHTREEPSGRENIRFGARQFRPVTPHLYNTDGDIDRLFSGLARAS